MNIYLVIYLHNFFLCFILFKYKMVKLKVDLSKNYKDDDQL